MIDDDAWTRIPLEETTGPPIRGVLTFEAFIQKSDAPNGISVGHPFKVGDKFCRASDVRDVGNAFRVTLEPIPR